MTSRTVSDRPETLCSPGTHTEPITYSTFSGWIGRPDDPQPPAEGTLHCDVAVVGGGLSGMATALRLARRGADVVLLEAEFCGYGAASRNAGQLSGKPGGDPQLLSALFPRRYRTIVRFARNAAHFVEDFLTRESIDCEYEPTGNAGAAVTTGQVKAARKNAEVLCAAGADERFGDARELGLPDGFLGGLFTPLGGTMNPGLFARGMRTALFASGARVFESTPAGAVEDTAAGVRITTPRGVVHAATAVLASNAYLPELSATPRRAAKPVWVNMVETDRIGHEELAGTGWTSRCGIATGHNIMESYRPTRRGTVVLGVRRLQPGRRPIAARTSDPAAVADLGRAFRERFPALRDTPLTRTWGGWIAMTPSQLPVAGFASAHVLYSVGCNGHGLAQAPYLGTLLADRIASDEAHDDLMAVWRAGTRFGPAPLCTAPALHAAWVADRLGDRRARRKGA